MKALLNLVLATHRYDIKWYLGQLDIYIPRYLQIWFINSGQFNHLFFIILNVFVCEYQRWCPMAVVISVLNYYIPVIHFLYICSDLEIDQFFLIFQAFSISTEQTEISVHQPLTKMLDILVFCSLALTKIEIFWCIRLDACANSDILTVTTKTA